MSGVQQVFSQVTAEHPLLQDASLLQLLLCGPGLHEGAQKRDQFPVLLRHCGVVEERQEETRYKELVTVRLDT